MMYDDNWHGGWGWGAWLAMGLVMLAFVGVLVAVLVVVLRSPNRRAGEATSETGDGSDEAQRILDARFAPARSTPMSTPSGVTSSREMTPKGLRID